MQELETQGWAHTSIMECEHGVSVRFQGKLSWAGPERQKPAIRRSWRRDKGRDGEVLLTWVSKCGISKSITQVWAPFQIPDLLSDLPVGKPEPPCLKPRVSSSSTNQCDSIIFLEVYNQFVPYLLETSGISL